MCGNVQLGALLSSFFFSPSCAVPTFDSEGFRNATLDVSWLFCSQTLGDTDNTQTNRTVGNPDFFFFPCHDFFFFFCRKPKKEKGKKKGFKCECFFWKGSSVVSEDAVQF